MDRFLSTLGMVCLLVVPGFASDRPESAALHDLPPADHAASSELVLAASPGTKPLTDRPAALGDIGGFRSMLARHGISFEIASLDEGFSKATDGGAGRYHGLTDVVLGVDTGAAGWWRGGTFVIDLQNTRGGDISDVVGDVQGVSNIVAPPGTRFAEYFLDQHLADGRWRIKIGKQDANADFVVSDGGGEFVNSSFGIIPTVPLPTFPAPALGVVVGWSPSGVIHVKAGTWDGAAELGSGVSTAIFDGSRGAVAAAELELTPFGDRILAGTYRIGIWRHTEVEVFCPPDTASLPKSGERLTGPATGLYFTIDQGVWESAGRRLSLFAQGGWGESDRSAVSRYFGGGLTLSGPFTRRTDDLVGIGVAYADLGRLELASPDCTSETVIELFYAAPILGWLTLKPDLQWIHRPGGLDGSAFVAGLRVATSF